MRNRLFVVVLLLSVSTVPLIAHADTIDDFTLQGDGHTITYSLPSSINFPNFNLFNFFSASAPATLDGTTSFTAFGEYYDTEIFPEISLLLSVPSSVFGTSTLDLLGAPFIDFDLTSPTTGIATFVPGSYALSSFSTPSQPVAPPVPFTLTITEETASTPEPSTLVFLTTGLIGGLGALRRRFTHH
jgi:PEP-CTERM motif